MPVKKGLGWLQIAGLGIGLVVAGQFAGWNYGLAAGGFANMCVAALLMGGMCFGLSMCVAELAAAIPNAGGIYIYCEAALGRLAGFAVGISVFAALTISTGAAAEFLSAYCASTFGFGGVTLKAILFIALTTLHVRSVGEGVKMTLVAGFIAVIALFTFGLAMLPHFNIANFDLNGSNPISFAGVFACIPFAILLFISIEQCATAAEEARDARTDIPRGMFTAILILAMTAFCVLVLGTGANGVTRLGMAADPLAAGSSHEAGWLRTLIGAGAVFGLLATIFSLQFGASRQLFALARESFVPACFARVNRRGAPHVALLLIGAIGFGMSFVPPDRVLVAFIMVLSLSYIVLQISFIRLRLTRPELERPFMAPGGIATGIVTLLLASTVFASSLSGDGILMTAIAGFLIISLTYYACTRHIRSSGASKPITEAAL
jgi:ethanolamine permease